MRLETGQIYLIVCDIESGLMKGTLFKFKYVVICAFLLHSYLGHPYQTCITLPCSDRNDSRNNPYSAASLIVSLMRSYLTHTSFTIQAGERQFRLSISWVEWNWAGNLWITSLTQYSVVHHALFVYWKNLMHLNLNFNCKTKNNSCKLTWRLNCLYFSGFGTSSQIVIEPDEGEERQLVINLVRSGGVLGVVAVQWEATLNGMLKHILFHLFSSILYIISNLWNLESFYKIWKISRDVSY